MIQVIQNIYHSFFNNDKGFSSRKLSAFTGVVIAAMVSIRFTNSENLIYIIGAWLIFSLLCLGIVTIEQLIKLKDGSGMISKKEEVKV